MQTHRPNALAPTPMATATATASPLVAELPAQLRIGCRFQFDVPQPVAAVVVVEPHQDERGRVLEESFDGDDVVGISTYLDVFGNRCRRMTLPAGRRSFSYTAAISNDAGFDKVRHDAAELAPADLPDDALAFLLPSRYCPSDELAATAGELFGAIAPGWRRIEAIAGWVNRHLTFAYGSSSPTKSATEAYRDRSGVCRDFAHLMITMCRALNVPARYVVGYLPDIAVPDPGTPMDFCAWVEVYLEDGWYTFDPRNHAQRRVGRTVVGRGRDAADVAMTTTFGRATLLAMTVRAEALG
jgi:transglutaminase-like putative cysteine protease